MKRCSSILVLISSALAIGCSNSKTIATSSSGSGSTMSTGTSMECKLTEAANDDFCGGANNPIDCSLVGSSKYDVCGVPLGTPGTDLARSTSVKEFAGSGPPDLACFSPAGYPKKPGTSQMVKMTGVAKIFSAGCSSDGLKIAIYTVNRTGGADEGSLGSLVGAEFTTSADCMANGKPTTIKGCTNDTRYECNYTYDAVPTETELVIKTYGDNWAELYDYNIYIPNSEVMAGSWSHDVRALAADDYVTIPQVAFGKPISKGNGAMAGEVHDCGNVRLEHAVADVNVDKGVTTYFTDNEDHPLPDLTRNDTSILGLYASFDIAPGPVDVAAMGFINGKPVTVGYFKARVFPDAVTAVTFRGLRPFQVP